MTPAGRPIRFLVSVIGGWTLLRVGMIWSETGALPNAFREVLPLPRSAQAVPTVILVTPIKPVTVVAPAPAADEYRAILINTAPVAARPKARQVEVATIAPITRHSAPIPAHVSATPPTAQGIPVPIPMPAGPSSRWSASAWLVARGGGTPGAAPGSQLGGSQAGMRLDRMIGHGFAMTTRVTTPLRGRGAELAPGIAWQPARLPMRVVAEYRVALDGGGSAPALGVSGGVNNLRLGAGLALEGYAQAGAIARQDVEGYVDGAMRVARPVAIDRVTLDLGIGAWGAKQRGAGRIDLGPSVAVRVPIGNGGGARLQLDWRQRVAGDARPGSGPALTLGADL